MFACQKTPLLPAIDEAGGAADIMPEECSTQETREREKEAAYANESMCREWRGPRQRYPESTQRICGKVIGADWGRGGLPGWIDSLSLSLFLSLSLRPPGLLQCGGGGELIIEAVKPSHSLVSVSNEVPTIKAL